MATEMITVKLDDTFLKEIDSFVETRGYQNRTEFIRNALREKLEDTKLKQALLELKRNYGKGKWHNTTDEELHRIREKVVKEFEEKFRKSPRA